MTALNRLFAVIAGLVGIALCWLGVELLLVGGSLYYVMAGLLLLAIAVTTWRRQARALTLFALLWGGTLLWGLWESGLDGWALAGRLGLFTGMGLWLLTPWARGWFGVPRWTKLNQAAFAVVLVAAVAGSAWIFWADRITGGTEAAGAPGDIAQAEWHHYGNNQGGSRFSPLTQISATNVGNLQRAWTYRLGVEPTGFPAGFEATPLQIGDRLYFCTGYNDIIALDAESGKQIWRFQPKVDVTGIFGQNCRGVSYYRVASAAPGTACAERLYTATIDARLLAVDARDGKPCRDFGDNGQVNLLTGLSKAPKGYYHITSPPAVIRGKLVLGGWVTDGQRIGEPSGVIRAFDATTGKLSWAWDMGRPDRTGLPPEGETYTPGTANSWGVMSSDEALGMVYVPTGNATPDFYGGLRTPEMDRYASSVVALDAETGRPRWSFQTVHHDLWDYDVASQPVLFDMADGTPALLQPTKRGELFLLDRRTGKPLAPVTERPVKAGNAIGERYSPTQPFSSLPSFTGPRPTEARMWGITPIDQAWCRYQFARARFEGSMTPVGDDKPTVQWPGALGGNNWGSAAIDPVRQIAFVNASAVMNYLQLMPRAEAERRGIRAGDKATLETVARTVPQDGTPYATITTPFLSPIGVPCSQPPYGLVGAVDLKTKKLLWQKPFGTAKDSGPMGLRLGLPIPMGVPNLGGAVVTASGLSFIGATQERRIRAFDTKTGRELWKDNLPAGGNASPMTYWSPRSKRQFVVIAVGGHGGIMSGHSDTLIAYALPAK